MKPNKPDEDSQDARPSIVATLLSLLGPDTLLLSWPLGSKGKKRKWGHLTLDDMRDPKYLAKLAEGNIGVAQGEKSNGLYSVDIDSDSEVEGFLALNPKLAKSTRSKGARGCNIWLRAPAGQSLATKEIKTGDGKEWGELRANGAQTIVHGKHPDGCAYQITNTAAPVLLDPRKIIWPDHVISPFLGKGDLCTDETEETEVTDDTQEIGGGSSGSSVSSVQGDKARGYTLIQSVDDVIAISLPSSAHTNHSHLLKLARAIKTLEQHRGVRFSPEERRAIFARWYDEATPFLRNGQTREEYLVEFLSSFGSAKYLIGEAATLAWQRALANPLPSEFLPHFQNQEMRLVIGFCLELQHIAGDKPFFLACRTVQKFLSHPSHTTAASWLRALVVDGLLDEIEKGKASTGKASRYRWKV